MSPAAVMNDPAAPHADASRPALRDVLLAPVRPSTWAAALFLVLSLPAGILWFTVLVTGASLGLGMAITLVGLPILAALGIVVQAFSALERLRVGALLGTAIANPHRDLSHLPLLRRVFERAKEPALWRDALYLMLRMPVGILTFTLAITFISIPLSLMLTPVIAPIAHGNMTLGWLVVDTPIEMAGAFLVGLALIVPAAWGLRGLAHLERVLAVALLGPSASELQARVDDLHASRARGTDADAAERRRIERDLHDGAQQRLIKLAMDLGIAVERMKHDPASAEGLVREAHEEAKRAIAELRDLARGIHPAVLADRGLDAALSALAAKSTVPVDVAVDIPTRPPAPVEAAAYFMIAESLANVAKHARATKASVVAERRGDVLRIEVRDNGGGGARIVPGGGLAGLSDRLAAFDGRLSVESPAGGPTRIVAEIPCG